ncbi:hypothetical protein N7466_008023 [Penicillium verhagenii]|uniref:uncharacterized protein n=1 Tax=Penicillium verhagenii TaxID=1562060 RepID=UPI0025457D2E|nr:uncharacterized protein N7466_008023 [Penicillium verhagenii]KAJ5923836.1 hypothetical protein N7466_008023 [Penicillium verhagenii]
MTAQLDHKEIRTSISPSSSSTLYSLNVTNDSSLFYPSRTLTVDARGINAFRLPLPPSQTEIAITLPDGNIGYVSSRNRRWSGNSVLSQPQIGDLIRTEYFFGPNRDPILYLLQTCSVTPEELKVTGKWTSRSARFTMPTGTTYEWAYAKQKRSDGQKLKLIVLHAISKEDSNEKEFQTRRVAQLVRSSDTRTPGTSSCSAGNGGELQIDEGALLTLQLDESIVVATCLVMLKREIDRRRVMQAAAIGGAGGGA